MTSDLTPFVRDLSPCPPLALAFIRGHSAARHCRREAEAGEFAQAHHAPKKAKNKVE